MALDLDRLNEQYEIGWQFEDGTVILDRDVTDPLDPIGYDADASPIYGPIRQQLIDHAAAPQFFCRRCGEPYAASQICRSQA